VIAANFEVRAGARRAVLPTSGGRLLFCTTQNLINLVAQMADLAQLTTQLTNDAERLNELRRYL
jgi:hypothetical protein